MENADILPDRIGTVPLDVGEVTDAVDDPTAASTEELAEDADDQDAQEADSDDNDESGKDDGSAPLGRAVPVRRGS